MLKSSMVGYDDTVQGCRGGTKRNRKGSDTAVKTRFMKLSKSSNWHTMGKAYENQIQEPGRRRMGAYQITMLALLELRTARDPELARNLPPVQNKA